MSTTATIPKQQLDFIAATAKQLAQRPIAAAGSRASNNKPEALPHPSRPVFLQLSAEQQDKVRQLHAVQIQVKTLKGAGEPFVLERESRLDCITAIKRRLAARSGIAPADQRAVLAGKALADYRTLLDYGVSSTATIHLARKPGAQIDASASASATAPIVPAPVAAATASAPSAPAIDPVSTANQSGEVWDEVVVAKEEAASEQELALMLSAETVRLQENKQFWARVKALLDPEFSSPAHSKHVLETMQRSLKQPH